MSLDLETFPSATEDIMEGAHLPSLNAGANECAGQAV